MIGLRDLPPLASRNATPALSEAIPAASLPSRMSARPYETGAEQRPQHGQAVLSAQPLTFFGALVQVLMVIAVIELMRASRQRISEVERVSALARVRVLFIA
jgi:hypothetical protein